MLGNPDSWIREIFAFLLVESGILDFGIRNTTQGIRNHANDWNRKSKFHRQRIRNPVHGIRSPRLSWIPCIGRQVTMLRAAITHPGKTVNTRNISGMLVSCKKKANQVWENWTETFLRYFKCSRFSRPHCKWLTLLSSCLTWVNARLHGDGDPR